MSSLFALPSVVLRSIAPHAGLGNVVHLDWRGDRWRFQAFGRSALCCAHQLIDSIERGQLVVSRREEG